MSWTTAGKNLSSKPTVNTVLRNNQTRWLETGLEKHRSHSSYVMDELADLEGVSSSIAGNAVVEWCSTPESAYPAGTRFAQVMLNLEGTPAVVWFQLPGNTPIAAPAAEDIEKCCCTPSGYHDPNHQPNFV